MKLFSGLKSEILTLLFLNPGTSFHVRDVARRLDRSPRGVLYDLNILEEDGFVLSEKLGNMRFFKLKKSFPGRENLKDLFLSYFGLPLYIKESLRDVMGIKDCFIYGSYADGTFDASSDLDLFILGDVEYEALYTVIKDLEERLSLEVNPQLMSLKEYKERRKEKDPYILDIESKKRIYLVHEGKEV
jgi:predicted nucleotidyltransferase